MAGTIAEKLDVPWGLVFLPSGTAVVGERNNGRLLSVTTTGKVRTLGVVAEVVGPSGLGEGGLLGLALAPDDPDILYAYLTTGSDNRVVKLSIAGGKVPTPKAIRTGIPTSTHHHGGALLFDADGMLLVSAGDAEQSALAQQKGSLAGKILRIRPDGRAASGNPFDNRTYSYGHRNIEGLAFDAAGRLWATEFGDKAADELNQIRAGGNYGWPNVEGVSSGSTYVSPKATWSPTSSCSPAGLAGHPIDRLRRCAAGPVPVLGRPRRHRRGETGPALRRRPWPDPRRASRARRLVVADHQQHRWPGDARSHRRQDPAGHVVTARRG